MDRLALTLKKELKGAVRLALLGVGSELRGDDAAGMLVAQGLKRLAVNKGAFCFQSYSGATAPENLTGQIKKFAPTHLVIVDAADIAQKPGTFSLIDPAAAGGVSFSTHVLPIKVMVDYFKASLDCTIVIVGIQPESMEFAQECSREVKKAALQLVKAIASLVAAGRRRGSI